ncbi:MAG: hypothetical protein Q6370_007970 [Candidatus Sigynarchaeota archaeon]
MPNSRFIQQIKRAYEAGTITLPVVAAAGASGIHLDFEVGDLLPAGYRFRAKITFDGSVLPGDRAETWVVDPSGTELAQLPGEQLVAGAEIFQLEATRRQLAKLGTTSRAFVAAEHWQADEKGTPVKHTSWMLRASVAVPAGLASGDMVYQLDVQLAKAIGTLRDVAYITYAGTTGQPIANPYAIQEDARKSDGKKSGYTVDRGFGLTSAVTYLQRVQGLFAEIGAYSRQIGGVTARPTFTPSTTSVYHDPLDGFTLRVPHEDAGRPGSEWIELRQVTYDPMKIGGAGRSMVRVASFVLDPTNPAPLRVTGSAEKYISFENFGEIETLVGQVGSLIASCGGLRATGTTTGRGITFHGVSSGHGEGRIAFTATTAIKSGVATLADGTTGLPVPGSDASSLDIKIGDAATAYYAEMVMRSGLMKGLTGNLPTSCGAIYWPGWVKDKDTGVWGWKYANSQEGLPMSQILATAERQLAGGVVLADQQGIYPAFAGWYNRPVIACTQVLPGWDVPAPAGGSGIGVAGEVVVDVGRDRPGTGDKAGQWQLRGLAFLNVHPAPGVNRLHFFTPLDAGDVPGVLAAGSMLVPIRNFVKGLNAAGAVVRRIVAAGNVNDVKADKYLALAVTFNIGGVDVTRAVMARVARDTSTSTSTSAWGIAGLEWSVMPTYRNSYHRIDWPGIYRGILPGGTANENRHQTETLVGQFDVDPTNPNPSLRTAWLQFCCIAFDAETGTSVYPVSGHPGLYGWLEAIGPAGIGPVGIYRIIDGLPAHPAMLVSEFHAGRLTRAEYEAGMLRVLGWFLEFMSQCPSQPAGYASAPGFPADIPLYEYPNPSWSNV